MCGIETKHVFHKIPTKCFQSPLHVHLDCFKTIVLVIASCKSHVSA